MKDRWSPSSYQGLHGIAPGGHGVKGEWIRPARTGSPGSGFRSTPALGRLGAGLGPSSLGSFSPGLVSAHIPHFRLGRAFRLFLVRHEVTDVRGFPGRPYLAGAVHAGRGRPSCADLIVPFAYIHRRRHTTTALLVLPAPAVGRLGAGAPVSAEAVHERVMLRRGSRPDRAGKAVLH